MQRSASGRGAALAVCLVAVAVAGAVGGAQQLTAAALFAGGLLIGYRYTAVVPAAVALALPIGFSVTLVGGVQVGLLDALVWGTAAGYAASFVRDRRLPQVTSADVAAAAFVAGVAISGTSAVGGGLWLHELALWAALAVVFHCSVRELRDPRARLLFFGSVGVTVAVESIYALEEFVSAAGSRFSRLGGAIVFPQPQGTLQHPNALGAFLAIATFLLGGCALAARGRARWAWLALAVLAALGTIAPFSRGAWISLAAGAICFVLLERRHRRVLGAALGAAAAAAAAVAAFDGGALGARLRSFGDVTSLNGFRVTLARDALHSIARHPLEGAGRFAETGIYAGRPTFETHPHDLFLGIGVFFGIPAMVAFAALVILCARSAWRARSSGPPSVSAEAVGVLAALAAFLVDGLFEYPFWSTTWTVETMLLLAVGVALAAARAEDRMPLPRSADLDERPGSRPTDHGCAGETASVGSQR